MVIAIDAMWPLVVCGSEALAETAEPLGSVNATTTATRAMQVSLNQRFP
jgi:hypothetical protein